MDEDRRREVITQLDELHTALKTRPESDENPSQPALAQVEELRAMVADQNLDPLSARAAASGLEQRMLAWEAEHPRLMDIATRVVRALEDAGL